MEPARFPNKADEPSHCIFPSPIFKHVKNACELMEAVSKPDAIRFSIKKKALNKFEKDYVHNFINEPYRCMIGKETVSYEEVRRMRKLLLSLFIILNAFLLSACNEAEEQETNNKETLATPVEAEEVDTGDFVVEKSVYGQISPVKQTPVMVPQPGEVSVLKVENGDKVDKDDHIATIKTQMGNQAIYAPVAGEIAHLGAKENSFQSNEEPIALVVDLEKVDANFSVTASTREQLDQDKKVNVYIDEKKYEGTVAAIDPMPNEAGQYPIAVELDNEDRNIAPGMAAKLIVPDKRMKDTIIIPT